LAYISVLPAQSSQPSITFSWGAEAKPSADQGDLVDIPDYLIGESFKANIKKACDVALDNCLASNEFLVKTQSSLSNRA
jgi:hypothetical protein